MENFTMEDIERLRGDYSLLSDEELLEARKRIQAFMNFSRAKWVAANLEIRKRGLES